MHFALSWDISASGDRWREINDAMKVLLKGYSWVKPLKTFYVIKVDAAEQREKLIDGLVEVVGRYSEAINFVATPVMSGGGYNGWLPSEMWEKIEKRAQ